MALTTACCQTSSNPLLNEIWSAVQLYNALPPVVAMNAEQKIQAVKCLDQICEKCATYMTDKAYYRIKGTPAGIVDSKRHLRYKAFNALMGQCSQEMQSLGGRMVTAPADFQLGGENYFLERLDPQHRPGFALSEHYKDWVDGPIGGRKKETFWDRMEDVEAEKMDEWSRTGKKPDELKQVWGYDQSARWDQCLYFDGNALKCASDDSLFKSDDKKTVYAGSGWAIWVCSMPMAENDTTRKFHNYIFSSTHEKGVHHHTSFLAGRPVMAAGEWIVDATGTIRVISAKSGHYRPTVDELFKFVTTFQQIPGDVLIRVDMGAPKPWKYYFVSELRSDLGGVRGGNGHVPGAQVAAVISQYAPSCANGLKDPRNIAP